MAIDNTADAYLEQEQQAWGRQHNKARQTAAQQKKAKALQATTEKTTKKIIAKVQPKVASGTGIGIVVAFVVLFIRGVSANLLGSKVLPKLDTKEQIHFGILMVVIFILVTLVIVLLFAAIIATAGVIEGIKFLGTEIIDWFKNIF